MERRELFKVIAGVAAGAGVTATSVVEAVPAPVLAVLEVPGAISNANAEYLRRMFEDNGLSETPFKDVKVVVLSQGMKLTLLDAQGHVLNRTIE